MSHRHQLLNAHTAEDNEHYDNLICYDQGLDPTVDVDDNPCGCGGPREDQVSRCWPCFYTRNQEEWVKSRESMKDFSPHPSGGWVKLPKIVDASAYGAGHSVAIYDEAATTATDLLESMTRARDQMIIGTPPQMFESHSFDSDDNPPKTERTPHYVSDEEIP